MSFSDRLGAAIAAVRTYAQIDGLSREIAAAWGARILDDVAAQAATEALAARKRSLADNPCRPIRKPLSGLRRPPRPRSTDREASLRRRRAEIVSGMVPPHIAAHFTPGEMAALSVIARDVQINGQCSMCVDKIAALAGICPRVVQKAQRLAERLGYFSIEARPRAGRKSDTNIIRVTSAEWASWLGLHRVNQNASHGKQMKTHTFPPLPDLASWRLDPAVPAPKGSSMRWSSATQAKGADARSPIERNDRLEAALARFEASVRARAAK